MILSIFSISICGFFLSISEINKIVQKNSKKRLEFGELDRQIKEEVREVGLDKLVEANANVVYGASRLLDKGSSNRGVELTNPIERDSKISEEEDIILDMPYALPPPEEPHLIAEGLKKKAITKN